MTDSEYNAALDAIEAQIARDYLAQASRITASVSLSQVTQLIATGEALKVVQMYQGAAYPEMLETLRAAYIKGGAQEIADLSKAAGRRVMAETGDVALTFDVRKPQAAAKLDEMLERTITGIRREQGNAIQAVIESGRARGDSAASVARQIVGTPGELSPTRTGGIAGLTGQDAQWIQNARDELATGDPAAMRNYFSRVRRDRRYDGIVQRAMDAGVPVSQADIDKIAKRYSERLLVTRAEVNASIDALEAYNTGRDQFYKMLVDDGYDPEGISKRWKTRGDNKVRNSHRQMNGQVQPNTQPFVTLSGYKLNHPGDRTLGAPLSEVARCRCRSVYQIKGLVL